MNGYSARQLVRYYRHCIANPEGRVLPPGGRAGWDDMSAADWLRWFRSCLMTKAMRGTESTGKGNRAAKRIQAIADAKAECKWCGQKTGSARERFCSRDCAFSYAC